MTKTVNPIIFIKNWIEDPSVAAIASSSKYVTQRVIKTLPVNAKTVIEYGPGDGVLTLKLLKHLPKDAKLLVIEANENFAKQLEKINDSRLIILHAKVEDAIHQLPELGFNQVDAVVSSIPFSLIDPGDRSIIVQKTHEVLNTGGRFIIFHQYKRAIIPTLKTFFTDVHTSFEILNLFPCYIFNAQKY